MNTDLMFSSEKDNWTTPQDFFNKLDSEFHFTLDPAADDTNHKCAKYYTKADSGLLHEWGERRYFATRRMAERYQSGCVNATARANDPTLQL